MRDGGVRTAGRLLAAALLIGALAGALPVFVIGLIDGDGLDYTWFAALAGMALALIAQLVNLLVLAVARRFGLTGAGLRAALLFVPTLAVVTITVPLVRGTDPGLDAVVLSTPVLITVVASWLLLPWCLAPLPRVAAAR